MKFVFLDIDGVLNSKEYLQGEDYSKENPPQWPSTVKDEEHEIGVRQLAVAHIARLNRLVQPDVCFILSSTWRRWYTLPQMQKMLEAKGFKGKLFGRTPTLGDRPRGLEIASWLESSLGIKLKFNEQGWPKFVILDDDGDMEFLRGQLVQTTYANGLQDEHIERAMELLDLS